MAIETRMDGTAGMSLPIRNSFRRDDSMPDNPVFFQFFSHRGPDNLSDELVPTAPTDSSIDKFSICGSQVQSAGRCLVMAIGTPW